MTPFTATTRRQRIEFDRVHAVRKPQTRGCFEFRRPTATTAQQPIRYKYATAADRQQPTKKKSGAVVVSKDKLREINEQRADRPNKTSSSPFSKGERIDLYFFDRQPPGGDGGDFFCTTDCQPQLHSDRLARDTADAATRFWAEAYGSIHIVVAVAVAFVLQTLRFALYSVVRPLLVGGLQTVGDYVVKPLLTAGFNGGVQPPLVFVRQVLEVAGEAVRPVCVVLGRVAEPLSAMLSSIRLVEINHYHSYGVEREDAEQRQQQHHARCTKVNIDHEYATEDV